MAVGKVAEEQRQSGSPKLQDSVPQRTTMSPFIRTPFPASFIVRPGRYGVSWRRELPIPVPGGIQETLAAALCTEWKVLGGGAQRAGSSQGQGDADASLPRMVWSPTMV